MVFSMLLARLSGTWERGSSVYRPPVRTPDWCDYRHRFNQRAVNRLIGVDALNLREVTKIFSSLIVSPSSAWSLREA